MQGMRQQISTERDHVSVTGRYVTSHKIVSLILKRIDILYNHFRETYPAGVFRTYSILDWKVS
jgi:hypothetical protein